MLYSISKAHNVNEKVLLKVNTSYLSINSIFIARC